MKAKLEALFEEYGRIGILTYFTIFFGVLVGFAVAISAGVEVQSAAGGAGTLGAAYVATKVTQPVRIGATLVLTPLIARVLRLRKAELSAS